MRRKAGIGFLAAILSIVLLVAYSRSIAEFFVGLFYKEPTETTQTTRLGQIEEISGAVSIKSNRQSGFQIVKGNRPLFHLDQIKTEMGSTAQLNFTSGWVLRLDSKKNIIIESYHPGKEDAPVLMTLTFGNYSVLKAGHSGTLFVLNQNKILSPQTPPITRERQIVVVSPAISSEKSVGLPSTTTPGHMPEKIKMGEEETLSSSYIESVLSLRATEFRHCQQNSLRDGQPAEGSLLLSLTIQPNGKVQSVKLLQNSTKSNPLADCAKSVVERVQFHTFSGLPITLTYPLDFK
jgi:hypothetical protein